MAGGKVNKPIDNTNASPSKRPIKLIICSDEEILGSTTNEYIGNYVKTTSDHVIVTNSRMEVLEGNKDKEFQ